MRKLSILIACLFFTGLAHAQVKISALPTYPQPLVGTEAIPASNVGLSTTQSYQITPNMVQSFLEGLANTWTGQNTFNSSVLLGSPTGGALGAGTVNAATGYYVNGVPVTLYSHVDKFTTTSGQTAFTLSAIPVLAAAAIVVLNGAVLTPTDDYSISGAALTLVNGAAAAQKLVVRY